MESKCMQLFDEIKSEILCILMNGYDFVLDILIGIIHRHLQNNRNLLELFVVKHFCLRLTRIVLCQTQQRSVTTFSRFLWKKYAAKLIGSTLIEMCCRPMYPSESWFTAYFFHKNLEKVVLCCIWHAQYQRNMVLDE